MTTISILGLGYVGLPLALALKEQGYAILGSTRTKEKALEINSQGISTYTLNYPHFNPELISGADIVIINIPPFAEELDWFKDFKIPKTTWVIFVSSTSKSPTLLEQEAWVAEHFNEWTILRFAGLYGGERHPGKSLSGRKELKGQDWPVNLIHRDDCIEFIKIVLEKKLKNKLFTLCANEHPTRKEYYTNYCKEKKLPLPEFDPEDRSQKESVSNKEMREFFNPRTL